MTQTTASQLQIFHSVFASHSLFIHFLHPFMLHLFFITPCRLMSHSVSALWWRSWHGGSSDSRNFTLFSLLLRLCVDWTDGLAVLDPTSPPCALSTPAICTLVPCTRGAINPEPSLLSLLLNTVILLAWRAWAPGGFFSAFSMLGTEREKILRSIYILSYTVRQSWLLLKSNSRAPQTVEIFIKHYVLHHSPLALI